MRKLRMLFVLIVVTVAMFLILTGCGGQKKQPSQEPAASNQSQSAQIILKAGHNQVADYPHGKVIHHFAQKVAELSKGRIKIEVFDNGTLGQEDQLFQGMRLGSVDMGKTITSVVGTVVPSFQVFDLPYLLKNREQMFKVLDGPIGQRMLKDLEEKAGVKGLFWMDQGTRNFYTVNKPVRTPDDLKGLKIRVIKSPIMVDTINAMGGAATPMAWGELYTAFKQGTVDGAENAPDAIWYSKQYEVVKYYSTTEHFRTPVLFMMSIKTWNKLSPEDQKIILDAAKESAGWGKDLYQQEADKLLEQMKEKGLQVVKDVDINAFKKAVEPVYPRYQDKIGVDLIKQIKGQ